MIVVDASTLTDYLLPVPHARSAVEDAAGEDPLGVLHAPSLIELEVLGALRGLERRGHLSPEAAGGAARDLDDVPLLRHAHGPLRPRIWELRHELTAYDASYLALAELLGASRLLTGDTGLAARARRSLGADAVLLVD